MQTEATDLRLPDFSSQDLLQATTSIITSLEALRETYGLETVLILTRGNAGQPRFSKVHASRKADRFLRNIVRMDVGILAQKIEGYAVSGTSTSNASAIALHGGTTKSCVKMKQKEQIKIARDLILNGLINILREENVPEDKIPKSMNYKSYHSKIVEQCGVILVGYPGEKGIANPGELDALMLKELLLRLGDGRCHWEKAPGQLVDAEASPSPSSSSSWSSSDSTYAPSHSSLSSRSMAHGMDAGSQTSPEASSMLGPLDSGRKSMSDSESGPTAGNSWPIKPEISSRDYVPSTKKFGATPTTPPTLSTPTHMFPLTFSSSKRVNTSPSPTSSDSMNNNMPLPNSTMTLSSLPSTPQHDLRSAAFHLPPLMLDEDPNRVSPHSFNLDLNLNFSRQPNYSPFQSSTDFVFLTDKPGYDDFDMADGTLPMFPDSNQDLFISPSFDPGVPTVGDGLSGPLWPSSTIQSYPPWLSHAWGTPTPS